MGLKYMGGGFLPGVPARDLTDDEVKQYDEKALLNSGLYKKAKSVKGPPEDKAAGKREEKS